MSVPLLYCYTTQDPLCLEKEYSDHAQLNGIKSFDVYDKEANLVKQGMLYDFSWAWFPCLSIEISEYCSWFHNLTVGSVRCPYNVNRTTNWLPCSNFFHSEIFWFCTVFPKVSLLSSLSNDFCTKMTLNKWSSVIPNAFGSLRGCAIVHPGTAWLKHNFLLFLCRNKRFFIQIHSWVMLSTRDSSPIGKPKTLWHHCEGTSRNVPLQPEQNWFNCHQKAIIIKAVPSLVHCVVLVAEGRQE